MSDKNLQASVELQVNTPGAEKVTQLKKEITELLAALGAAGATASTSLDKAASKIAALSAKAAAARDKELTAEQSHARKLELIEKQKELVVARQEAKRLEQASSIDKRIEVERERHANKLAAIDRKNQVAKEAAEAKRAQLATTADAKTLASANNLAAVQAQILARQDAADQRVHDTRLRRLAALAAAQARAGQAGDLARMAGSSQQSNWVNGGRVLNPNAARTMAFAEDASRSAALAEAAGLRAANSYGNRFKTAMTGWGAASSQSFMSSMQAGMNNGMAGMVAGLGTLFAAKKLYKDNVDEATIHYGMQSAYGGDADQGTKRGAAAEARIMKMSNKYGTNYAQTGKESIGFVSAAAASGMTDKDTYDTLEGFAATKAARHLTDGQMNKAMRAVAEMTGKNFVLSKEVKQQLNNDIPGLLTDVEKYLEHNSGGLIKNSDDVAKLLSGRMKDAQGKTVRLDSKKFTPDFGRYLENKNGKAALEAAETSPMAQVNRFQNAIFELNTTMGKSGAAEGFAKAMKKVVAALESPEIRAMFGRMGVSLKAVADGMTPVIVAAAAWAKKNTGLIETTLGIIGKVSAVSLGFKVFLGVIGFVLSPLRLLAGAVLTLGGGFSGLKTKAASLLSGLQTLGSTPTWSTVKTKVAEMASSVSGAFATAGRGAKTFGGVVMKLGSDLSSSSTRAGAFGRALTTLRTSMGSAGSAAAQLGQKLTKMIGGALRTLNGAVRAAGIAAAMSQGSDLLASVRASKGLEKLGGKTNAQLSDVELEQKQELLATAAGAQKGTRDGLVSGLTVAAMDAMGLKASDKIEGTLTAINEKLRETQVEFTRREEARAKAGEKPEPTGPKELTGNAIVTGEAKGKKGRSAHGGASTEASAEKQSADQAYADRVANIKQERAAAEESLKAQLEDASISYAKFYERKADLANKALDEEEAALKAKIAGDIAAEKIKLAAARDGADKKASNLKIATLEKQLVDETATLEAKRGKELERIGTEQSKIAKTEDRYFATLLAKVNALNGFHDSQSGYDAVDAEHEGDYERADRMDPDGSKGYRKTVDSSVATDKRLVDMKAFDERQAESNNALATQEAEIQLRVMQGLSTKQAAEDEILGLKKGQAQENIRLLEQELKMANPLSVQEKLQKELIANKQTLVQVSAHQVELENTISSAASEALQSVLNGTKGIGGALKGFVQSVTQSILKMLSDDMAGGVLKWMRGSGGSGDSILGAFTSMMGGGGTGAGGAARGAEAGFNFAGAGTGGASGGGIASTLSGIASFFGFSEGGPVFGAGSGTSDSIPANLSHGEYVFTAKDVDAMGGVGQLDSFRKKLHTLSFADGGAVSGAAQSASANRSSGLFGAVTGAAGGVVMNISTPDANSFRSSKTQLMSQYQFAAAVAARRNS